MQKIGSLAFIFRMGQPQILVKSSMDIWLSYARNDQPNLNWASDLTKIGGNSTGMDIDKFTDTPSPNLSVTIKANRDNAAGGYQ